MPHSKHSNRSIRSAQSNNSTLVGSNDGNDTIQWDGDTQGLLGIAHGSAGMIFAHSKKTVVKVYLGGGSRSIENSETERQAYRNLEQHLVRGGLPFGHVLRCYDIENPDGLLLERCRETVRQRIRSPNYSPQSEALSLAIQATKGLSCVHYCGIIQGDVGCHNMLLDNDGTLKIADFAGSSVDGCAFAPSVDYEVGSKLPGDYGPTVRSDIFALGSAIYEMITRKPPYKGYSYVDVQNLFEHKQFPNDFGELSGLGHIAETCWGKGGVSYDNVEEVLRDLYDLDIFCPTPIYSSNLVTTMSQPTIKSKRRPVVLREASPEPNQRTHRKRQRERSTYVNSQRKENETQESRSSGRSRKSSRNTIRNTRQGHGRKEYFDGPMDHLVHRLQALLSGKSQSLRSRKRSYY